MIRNIKLWCYKFPFKDFWRLKILKILTFEDFIRWKCQEISEGSKGWYRKNRLFSTSATSGQHQTSTGGGSSVIFPMQTLEGVIIYHFQTELRVTAGRFRYGGIHIDVMRDITGWPGPGMERFNNSWIPICLHSQYSAPRPVVAVGKIRSLCGVVNILWIAVTSPEAILNSYSVKIMFYKSPPYFIVLDC